MCLCVIESLCGKLILRQGVVTVLWFTDTVAFCHTGKICVERRGPTGRGEVVQVRVEHVARTLARAVGGRRELGGKVAVRVAAWWVEAVAAGHQGGERTIHFAC